MKINSNKCFIYNGRKYHVCALKVDWETLKALPYDAAGNKWYLTEVIGDREKVLYNNLGWNMAMFKTIKDAHRYVRDWDFTLEPL